MLATSDNWLMSCLSNRPSNPAYHIEDCQISKWSHSLFTAHPVNKLTMISMTFQNNLDLTWRGFLFRTGLSDWLILAFMHPTRLTDIVQKFEELSMVIRSVFADNNKMSLTRQIFFPPPFSWSSSGLCSPEIRSTRW